MKTAASSTSRPATRPPTPSAGKTWRTGLTSVAIALAANLTVLTVASLAGVEMVAAQMSIGVLQVAMATGMPLLVATLVLSLLRGWGVRTWRALATTGLVIGLVSSAAPLSVPAQDSTRVALAAMHVITGVVWFLVLRPAAARAEG